jgi:hypothetical protein
MGNKSGKNKTSTVQEPTPPPLPKIEGESKFFTEDIIRALMEALPSQEHREKWTMLYNSDTHGKSFIQFLNRVVGMGPTLSTPN